MGDGLTEKSESLSPSMTLETLDGMYATGLAEVPMTAATGWMDIAVVLLLPLMTEVMPFLACFLNESMMSCVSGCIQEAVGAHGGLVIHKHLVAFQTAL